MSYIYILLLHMTFFALLSPLGVLKTHSLPYGSNYIWKQHKQMIENSSLPDLDCLAWTLPWIARTDTTTAKINSKLMTNFSTLHFWVSDWVKYTYIQTIPAIDIPYMVKVETNNATIQHFESLSSMLPTHVSFHAWAKSTNKTNWTKMKRNAPINPTYIQPKQLSLWLL